MTRAKLVQETIWRTVCVCLSSAPHPPSPSLCTQAHKRSWNRSLIRIGDGPEADLAHLCASQFGQSSIGAHFFWRPKDEDDCGESVHARASTKEQKITDINHRPIDRTLVNRKKAKKVMHRFRGNCCCCCCSLRCFCRQLRLPSNVTAANVSMHLTSLAVYVINNNHHPHHRNHRHQRRQQHH